MIASRQSALSAVSLAGLLGVTRLAAGADSGCLEPWLEAQTQLRAWTAQVTQIRSFKTLVEPLRVQGQVWFQAPDRFRWEIGRPAATIALRQSNQVLVIYPQLKRLERYSLGADRPGPWQDTVALLEAGFPQSGKELERRFSILKQEVQSQVCRITLEPKSSRARRLIPVITLELATEELSLKATELVFADGSTLRNEFSQARPNPVLDPALFDPPREDEYREVKPP